MTSREELLKEVARNSGDLHEQSEEAVKQLKLTLGRFAWFRSEISQPMNRRRIWTFSNIPHDHLTSSVTFHGGRAALSGINQYGHTYAHIEEPLPQGRTHRAATRELATPFIPRLLTVHGSRITVDTPTKAVPGPEMGPFVIEGGRFRLTTVYDTSTKGVKVKAGEMVVEPGYGVIDDQTQEEDAFELPDEVLLPRLAIMTRTIKATTAIFERVAKQDPAVETSVTYNVSSRRAD